MILLNKQQVESAELLLEEITNRIYNESSIPYPKFSLIDTWSAVVWHEEQGDIECSNSWIDKHMFEKLVHAVQQTKSSKHFYIAWAYRELDERKKPLLRVIIELPFIWDEVESYEANIDYSPSQFYVFDQSLNWFIHVDDSVLLAGRHEFMTIMNDELGGIEKIEKMFEEYLLDVSSEDTNSWVSLMANRVRKQHKNLINF